MGTVRGIILFLALSNFIVLAVYTNKEKIALKRFRKKAESILYRDYMQEDVFLIRWLRARDLNVAAATEMLTRANKWRLENKMDTILNETILTFPAPPYYVDGFSYSGRPVVTMDLGRIDMRSLIVNGKRKQLVRYIDQLLEISEVGLRYLRTVFTRYEISDGIIIIDLSGFNLRQHACIACISVHYEWLRHIENYIPGLIKNFILINTPRTYARVLNQVKSTLSPKTLQGLTVYGRNRNLWTRNILRAIPATQIRKQFGGTKPEEVQCPATNFTCQFIVFFKIHDVYKVFPLLKDGNNTLQVPKNRIK